MLTTCGDRFSALGVSATQRVNARIETAPPLSTGMSAQNAHREERTFETRQEQAIELLAKLRVAGRGYTSKRQTGREYKYDI
jgi:hypothetical protein